MQITIKPTRTWLIGADFFLIIILITGFCQDKYDCNIAIGIAAGAILGVLLTLLMKVKRIGVLFQIGMSYYWTGAIMNFFGFTKSLRERNEYYFIFAIIIIIITMVHMVQIEDLKQ